MINKKYKKNRYFTFFSVERICIVILYYFPSVPGQNLHKFFSNILTYRDLLSSPNSRNVNLIRGIEVIFDKVCNKSILVNDGSISHNQVNLIIFKVLNNLLLVIFRQQVWRKIFKLGGIFSVSEEIKQR